MVSIILQNSSVEILWKKNEKFIEKHWTLTTCKYKYKSIKTFVMLIIIFFTYVIILCRPYVNSINFIEIKIDKTCIFLWIIFHRCVENKNEISLECLPTKYNRVLHLGIDIKTNFVDLYSCCWVIRQDAISI